MATERAASRLIPAKVWEQKVKGRRALWTEWRLTWMGLKRFLIGAPKPTVEPIVAERLRIAQMALDVADLLKYNDRRSNLAVLIDARFLLDCAEALDADDSAEGEKGST